MNVLETLHNELKNKNWTKEEKARYLYIRSCELFYYDQRYYFCRYFENAMERRNQIRNRKIDLENVTDFSVICTSHIIEVYKKLLFEFVNIEGNVEGEAHPWLTFDDGTREIKADSIENNDITRIKMKLNTLGYNNIQSESNYDEHLKEIDKNIGYIKDDYQNTIIKSRVKEMQEEYDKVKGPTTNYLFYQLYTITRYFEEYKKFKNFSDVEYALSYLGEKFFDNNFFDFSKAVSLFNTDADENWSFYNIYPISLDGDIIYYLLTNENGENEFYLIHREDVLGYTRTLKGLNKSRISQYF